MELCIISLLLALLYTKEDMYPLYWIILYVGLLICQMSDVRVTKNRKKAFPLKGKIILVIWLFSCEYRGDFWLEEWLLHRDAAT